MPARILIVDDEVGMQIALREVLQRQGYQVVIAKDALVALTRLENETFDVVLTDVRMPEMNGMELLGRIRARWPETPVLVMTAYGAIEDAVEAMKKGAADYLLKPFSTDTVEEVVARLLKRRGAEDADPDAKTDDGETANGYAVDPIASSPQMQGVLRLAREVADSTATVLVQGESGTGKEVVARYIHRHSGRGGRSFVAVNCAALPENLLESELFGHEKGAFTGAVLARKGKFELANRGTLLLDEVSEMDLGLQAKLLRVLQEREIDPVGSQRPVSLDVRVVATTNRNLADHVARGKFREDLYYRLQVITVEIPPLRVRRADVLPLSEFFVRRLCRINRRPRKRLSEAMRQYLLEQPWRGNVRELENHLERAVLLCKDEEITPENIFLGGAAQQYRVVPVSPGVPYGGTNGTARGLSAATFQLGRPTLDHAAAPLPPVNHVAASRAAEGEDSILAPGELVTLEEMERRLILRTLEQVNGNRTRAADLLGVSVRTIRNKLNLYGLGASSLEPKEVAAAG